MREYCFVCNQTKEDFNWKTADIGDGKVHWICGLHYIHSHIDMIPDSTRKDQEKYAKSIIQPWRSGEPSREFMELYPKQAKGMFSAKERRTAKYVWKDQPNWKNLKKTI